MTTTDDERSSVCPQCGAVYGKKQPKRPHFLKEWMEREGIIAERLAEDIGANKSNVSRWRGGQSFGSKWQRALAERFAVTPDALFRHPDEERLRRALAGRSKSEVERILAAIEDLSLRCRSLMSK